MRAGSFTLAREEPDAQHYTSAGAGGPVVGPLHPLRHARLPGPAVTDAGGDCDTATHKGASSRPAPAAKCERARDLGGPAPA